MIQSKLRNQSDITQTEEATKQRYVLPLLAALGFDHIHLMLNQNTHWISA